ncbi:hypothetical protein DFQ05_2639 [Winogradskyella wandonensis]|uniref:Uncharacterized protein n=1 Tax=Winogradskyella wandonensis TaxID=1442586 RepID=A0A4R1KM96_9FLAO|nr:hypothetical protein [Winogradskyella wandonensis]TCK64899.1 hypothetical protein DFQ05_2639 [Winogradskyella wandonensis]
MSLNKDMQALIDSIRLPVLFFLPDKLVEDESDDIKQQLEDIGFIKQLFFLDKDNRVSNYKEGIDDYAILEKQKLLKSNIFQLLELKSKLDSKSFDYLLTNYNNELKSWLWSSQWLSDNAKHQVKGYSKVMQSTLKTQKNALRDHQLELIRQFPKLIRFINEEESKETINNRLKAYNSKVKKLGSNTNNYNNNNRVLLTEADADKYLLKTVFNIKQ